MRLFIGNENCKFTRVTQTWLKVAQTCDKVVPTWLKVAQTCDKVAPTWHKVPQTFYGFRNNEKLKLYFGNNVILPMNF